MIYRLIHWGTHACIWLVQLRRPLTFSRDIFCDHFCSSTWIVHGLMIYCDTLQRRTIHVSNQYNALIAKRLLNSPKLDSQGNCHRKSKPFFASNDQCHHWYGWLHDTATHQLLISLTNGYQRPTHRCANPNETLFEILSKNHQKSMRTHCNTWVFYNQKGGSRCPANNASELNPPPRPGLPVPIAVD